MRRRAFVKSGLLFVPALLLPRKSLAQTFGRTPAFLGAANHPAAASGGGGGSGIAFDAASNATAALSGTTLTWTHVCTGSNLALFVAVVTGGGPTITGVTYNTVAMTQLFNGDSSGGVVARLSGWILINPASGSHSVVATFASDLASNPGTGGGTSWTGVNQTGGVGNSWRTPPSLAGGSASSNPSITVSNAANNDVVLGALSNWNTNPVAVQTERCQQLNYATAAYDFSIESAAATGSQNMTYTAGSWWTIGGVALIPA